MSLGAARRPFRCTEVDCDFPLGGKCARLHSDPATDCDALVRISAAAVGKDEDGNDVPSSPENDVVDDDTTPPWTGTHIEYGRFEELTWRARPRLVAVLGPHDAGKTSLLASLFLQIANGQYETLAYRFSSSRTLLSFDQLILRANEWDGGRDSQIVEHTSKATGSNFLHLGFRPLRGNSSNREFEARHLDVLFSDIAGELASSWAKNAKGDAASALAFVQSADAVLLICDASKLMHQQEGPRYDAEIAGILRRVGQAVRGSPQQPTISLVFTKADQVPDLLAQEQRATIPFDENVWSRPLKSGAIRTAMRSLAQRQISLAAFCVSAFPVPLAKGQPIGVVAPFEHAITYSDRTILVPRPKLPLTKQMSSFDTYGSMIRDWE